MGGIGRVMQQYIGFKLDDSEYTIPILKVREIINTPPITKLPQSPYYVRGIINLRGRVTPIIDLKTLVSGGQTEAGAKVIVVLTARMTFGILVDAITSVINIDESKIEPPEDFLNENIERIEGVARFDDRMVILLDTDKLVDMHGMDIFEEPAGLLKGGKPQASLEGGKGPEAKPLAAGGGAGGGRPRVEAAPRADEPREAAGIRADAGDVKAAGEALAQKFSHDKKKTYLINSMVELIDTLASHDYDRADMMISKIIKTSESETDLYREVGMVTRKLHNTIKEFRAMLDPRIKKLADQEVPTAVDSLQFVISRTEEAAHRTMEIVEKYISEMSEMSERLDGIKSPKEAVRYLKKFRDEFQQDLTEILLAQEYQDITGNAIRKVIDLVNNIETELIGLIATFGVKLDVTDVKEEKKVLEKLSQNDVEKLLEEFGF